MEHDVCSQERSKEIDYIFKFGDIPIWYLIAAIILMIVVFLLSKKLAVALLVGYIMIILSETMLFRAPFDGLHFQSHLFWSYEFWEIQRKQIIANILLFIPLGLIIGHLWRWKGILSGFVLSIIVELLQLVSQRGLFEFDDILHNTLGAAISVSIYIFVESMIKKKGTQ